MARLAVGTQHTPPGGEPTPTDRPQAAHGDDWPERVAVLETLRLVFGFTALRGVQEAAVRAALERRDALVVAPTGGGKSLCFALPAVLRGGLVLCVSPLIALMQDQVAGLQAKGVAADYLASSRSAAERAAIFAALDAAAGPGDQPSSGQRLALLYVTPELLATDSFRARLASLHARGAVQLLAIDEAHAISEYGHSFRPTYRALGRVRSLLKGCPCMALTATATPQVQADIVASLHLRQPQLLLESFNRPNIAYTVLLVDVQQPGDELRPHPAAAAAAAGGADEAGPEELGLDADDPDHAGYRHLLSLLRPGGRARQRCASVHAPTGHVKPISGNSGRDNKQHQQQQARAAATAAGASATATGAAAGPGPSSGGWPGPVAIVYALKRAVVDELVRRLQREGLEVAGYHAAMRDALRADVLTRWRAGRLQAVVATVAFGMGVDKADIELVVHYNLPRSVEGFYQESGRAGRSGQPARSVLLYGSRDRRRMDWILAKEAAKSAKQGARRRKGRAPAAAAAAAAEPGAADSGAGSAGTQASAQAQFGAVVELCTQPACRRARLLRHFGENHSSSGAAGLGPCCDFCSSPQAARAAASQLQALEVAALQWRGRARLAAKRARGDGEGVLWAVGVAGSGSEGEGEGEGSEPSSDDLDVPDVDADSAAVSAALAAARSASGARAGSSSDTGSLLAVMLQAEQQAEAQAAAGGARSKSALSRLLASKRAGDRRQQGSSVPAGPPPGVPDSVRASRRAKLAELLSGNSALAGGVSAEALAEAAACFEAAACTGPGMTDGQHKAAMVALAGAVRGAASWLALPDASLAGLSGGALAAVLRASVGAVLAQAIALHIAAHGLGAAGDEARLTASLGRLALIPVTVEALQASGAAKQVRQMRKHPRPGVAAAAAGVVEAWRAALS